MTMVRTSGLPDDADQLHKGTLYDFDFLFMDGRWLVQIPSIREDRCYYAPEKWEQQDWIVARGDAVSSAGYELSWWLHDESALRDVLSRLAPFLVAPLPPELQAIAAPLAAV